MTTISTKILSKNNKNFENAATKLYNCPTEATRERMQALLASHTAWCEGEAVLFSSPGRIEVSGNHTDHNNGKVVAAAVSVDTLAAVTPSNDKWIVIKSEGFADVIVDITDLQFHEEECGTSQALVRGVLKCYHDRGYRIGAFSATTVSGVFKGAGMSSSAAFELLVTQILNELYNGGTIDAVERAVISQYAENEFFGKPSGLMDQAAIALGGISYIDFETPTAPKVNKLSFPFDDLAVVVINCGGDHSDLTPNYAAIKGEMEQIAGFFGQKKLRFVDPAVFYASMKALKESFSGRAILRAMHFFEENERVENLMKAIASKDRSAFLSLINQSGESSYCKLQNLYPEGHTEEPVPLGLAIAKAQPGVLAARVHGGGFAGTILTFVEEGFKDAFVGYMVSLYGQENVYDIRIREAGAIKIEL